MAETANTYQWTVFYMEFADKLLGYRNNRSGLLALLAEAFASVGESNPFDGKERLEDICPFTVFGCFNKGQADRTRSRIAEAIGKRLGVQATVPQVFLGVPVLNSMNAWFFPYKNERKDTDIPNLWAMFTAALAYAEQPSTQTHSEFIRCYDIVRLQKFVSWNLSMALYWIRPKHYLNLDSRNREFLTKRGNHLFSGLPVVPQYNLPDAKTYIALVNFCIEKFRDSQFPFHNFPELSYHVWGSSQDKPTLPPVTVTVNKELSKPTPLPVVEYVSREPNYWLYAPGENSYKWDEFHAQSIMGLGWDEIGNYLQYPDKVSLRKAMQKAYDPSLSYKNAVHATWQFAHVMMPGDIVIAKKGLHRIVGRGVVQSDYFFDQNRKDFKHVRSVRWTHKGDWEHPGQAAMKTLTDITPYTEYVEELEALFADSEIDEMEIIEDRAVLNKLYTEANFLDEVFLDAAKYHELAGLLRYKKNLIIQGAPGVGKTFTARRLAYSMMGEKDDRRVMMVQFHQSYSYEDFIMGYRPSRDGFELVKGPFYEFCKVAQDNDDLEYFFLIDEINRGNLSKIFGELLMLAETDKRGESLRLLYSNEQFSVPKNVYIIGMMNTADRSLALIDYALRRRFAFYTLEPAFESTGLQDMVAACGNPRLAKLVEMVKVLNTYIASDEALGAGFYIGHSYLCPNEDTSDTWLASVVNHELIPLLQEYWFDDPAKVSHWSAQLRGVLQ